MKATSIILGFCILFSANSFGSTTIIDDFEGGVGRWNTTLPYGDYHNIRYVGVGGEGRRRSGAFRADCLIKNKGLTHIVFYKDVDVDLSTVGGVTLWAKAVNMPGTRLLLYVVSSDGKEAFYMIKDYKNDTDKWQNLSVSFRKDSPEASEKINIASKATKIGIMLQAFQPIDGKLYIDNVALTPSENGAWLSPRIITPNGDGILDSAKITVRAPKNTPITIRVEDAAGKTVETLASKQPSTGKEMIFDWRAIQGQKTVPAGDYNVVVTLGDNPEINMPVTVQIRNPWNPITKQPKELMSLGVWFAAQPPLTPYPADQAGAKAYYDNSLKDIAEMGFNTVVVVGLPENLWSTFLKSAREHNLKVIIDIPVLAHIIRTSGPLDEGQIEQILEKTKSLVKGYENIIIRYMTADEPRPNEMERWAVVHRIMNSMLPKQPGMSIVCTPGSMQSMVKSVPLDEAVFDCYPQRTETPIPSIGFFLGKVKSYREAAGTLPLWATVQSFEAESGWRYPIPVELRLSVYHALAAGARGYIFFMYNSLPFYGEKIKGLVDTKGDHAPIAEEACALLTQLNKVLPVIHKFPASSFKYCQKPPLSIGQYSREDGKHLIIIANASPTEKYSGSVDLQADGVYVDMLSGKPYTIDSGKLELQLSPAGAVVLVPKDL